MANKIRARAKLCYRNASRVLQHVPGFENATYVEGIAVMKPVFPFEHAWVELDGEIVDPTLPEDEIAYFPGLRFQGRHGLAEAMLLPKTSKEDFPIFYRFGWSGSDSLEFCKAWDDAWDYVFEQGLVTGEKPPSCVERWKARRSQVSGSQDHTSSR